jgi:hypothetical protein
MLTHYLVAASWRPLSLDCGTPNGGWTRRIRWIRADTAGMVVVDEEEFRRLPGMIALLRAAQALARGDMPEAVKNARRVLDLAPGDAHLMLGGAASVLGLAAWASGDLEAACRMTADGMANVRLAGYISSAIGGAIVLADIQIAQGRLHEAMTTYERALQWATEPGAPVQRGAADMYVGMSNLYREHNDLKTPRSTCSPARLWVSMPGYRKTRIAGARRWRAYGRPKAIWMRRSTCSTRPSACTMLTFPRMCVRSRRGRHGCG